MKKFLVISLLFSSIFSGTLFGQTNLTAVFDAGNQAVRLNWNMVNVNTRTSYMLLRSTDGISWTEAAKDRMLRMYSEDDIYFFNDRYYSKGRNLYRLRILDAYNNTIALSPVVAVNTASRNELPVREERTGTQGSIAPRISESQNANSWVIYPNPATDLLKLMYKGQAELKGVVNVQIQDITGKTVIKFRSGSMYKSIQIPISNLQRGSYFIQVSVLNEVMMNQKFIKQ